MRQLWLGAACAALMSPAAVAQGKGTEPSSAKAFRVAYVRPAKVEKGSKWAAKLLLDVDREYKANLGKLKLEEDKLASKRKEQSYWTPGSEVYDRMKLEIVGLETTVQNASSMYRQWWQRRRAEAHVAIHHEIAKRAGEIAKASGYAIVLTRNEIPAKAPVTMQLTAIQTSSILWASDAHDLTDKVIQLIDANQAVDAVSNGNQKGPSKKDDKDDKDDG